MGDLYPTKTRLRLLAQVANSQVISDHRGQAGVAWLYPDAPTSWADPVKVTARIREMARAGWVRLELETWIPTETGYAVLAKGGA